MTCWPHSSDSSVLSKQFVAQEWVQNDSGVPKYTTLSQCCIKILYNVNIKIVNNCSVYGETI